MLYHSHSPIKVGFTERLIRTIRLLISRYFTLKNTAAFIQDLNKIMLIHNQRPHRSLSNFSPLKAHWEDHDTFVYLNSTPMKEIQCW